jgi:uncharacterized membrane protein
MNNNQGKGKVLKVYLPILCGAVVVFGLSLIPVFCDIAYSRAGIFYGSLLFVVMLGVAVLLVLYMEPFSEARAEHRDYRVVQFTLRIELAFAIGAIITGLLLVVSQLGFIPSL